MNKFKSMVAVCATVGMLWSTVYAQETRDLGYKVKIEEGQVTVTEDALVSDIDNSNLDVSVVKQQGDTRTTIFTGKLKNYDNGRWVYTDFSEIQFMAVIEWEGPEDELIYIIPSKNISDVEVEATSNTTKITGQNAGNNETSSPSEAYKYGIGDVIIKNAENEKINSLKDAAELSAITIAKNTFDAAPVTIYAAIYDDGKLTNIKQLSVNADQANKSYVRYDLNLPLDNVTPKTKIKLMIWNGTTLMPYSLCTDMFYSYKIDLQTTVNQLYTFPITSTSGASKFKVDFNGEWFSIVDLCKDTDTENISVGTVSENIRIDEVTSTGFTFTFIGTQQDKCVNKFVLKAKKTGSTYINVEEILN